MSPAHQVMKFDKLKEIHYGWVLSTTQPRDYALCAMEEKDRTEWMSAIQVVIDNTVMTERVSSFPTHRTISQFMF